MANTIQLKRSSVVGRVPDSANVSVGEPVVNLADKKLYTKNGSGDIVQIAAGNLQGLADVSNASPSLNDVLSWNGTKWAPAVVSGSGTTVYANVIVGDARAKEFTANGTGSTFDMDFAPGSANSVIVFVDGVLQAPDTNYSVSNDILIFTAAPNTNAIVSVRYFDSSNILSTAAVPESGNLYFTNARARGAISVTGAGSYDSSTGIITITGGVTSVGGAAGAVSNAQLASAITSSGVLTTANISEVNNLYFTNARTYSNVISIGFATNANVGLKANITDLTTANVSELTNLYFTNARVYSNVTSIGYATNANVALKANVADLTTANVAEVSNLYFTNARAYANILLANIAALNDVSANVPVAGQALVWDANVNLWAPGNVAATSTATTGTVLYSRFEYTAANNQTVFTGADDNSKTLKVNQGFAEVFVNGIRLVPNVDYTANSTHVTLTEGTDLNDAVGIINFVDATADFAADTFTGDGSTTTFALSREPSNEASILVSFNGVKQFASEYTLSGTSLIFDSAPDSGTNIEVVFMGASQPSTANGGWVEISTNTTAVVSTKYMANTVGGTFTITLPSGPVFGDSVIVLDATNSFDTSNVLVSRNGNKINGQNDDLYLDVEGSYTELVYYNSTYGWRVIS